MDLFSFGSAESPASLPKATPNRVMMPSKYFDSARTSPAVPSPDLVYARNADFHTLLSLLVEKYESAVAEQKNVPGGQATREMAVQTDFDDWPGPKAVNSMPSFVSDEKPETAAIPRFTPSTSKETPEPLPKDDGRCWSRVQRHALRIIRWPGFDFVVGFVILANSATIGIELHLLLERRDASPMMIMEYVFLVAYTLELVLRGVALGWGMCRDAWVRFDTLLVFFGFCSVIAHLMEGQDDDSVLMRSLDQIIMLRLLRLLRLVRAVRMMGKWKTLWKLASGAMHGLEPMASVLVLLFFAVFMYACIAAEMIARDPDLRSDPVTRVIVEDYFSTMPKIFMTMMQFVMADSVNAVYKPIILVKPILSVVFLGIFFIITVLLLNLITAVLVDDAISRSQLDAQMQAEAKRRQWECVEPQIRAAFIALDADGGGTLAINEILNADFTKLGDGRFKDVAGFLKQDVLADLYDIIDADGSGSITEDELVNGLAHFALADSSFELAHIKQAVKATAVQIKHLAKDVDRIRSVVAPRGRTTLRSGSKSPTEEGRTETAAV